MSVPRPPATVSAGDAAAAPGACAGVKAARVNDKARRALATAFVDMWLERDLETARGLWVTDFLALATRASLTTVKAVSPAEAEAWCMKALPKQDKQTTTSAKRETAIAAAWTAAGEPDALKPARAVLVGLLAVETKSAVAPDLVEKHWGLLVSGKAQVPAEVPAGGLAGAPGRAGGNGVEGTRRARPAGGAASRAPGAAADKGYEKAWDANVNTWCAERLLARKGMGRFVGTRAVAAVAGGGVVGALSRVTALVNNMLSVDAMAATAVDLLATLKPAHGSYHIWDVPAELKPSDRREDSVFLSIRLCSGGEPLLLSLRVKSGDEGQWVTQSAGWVWEHTEAALSLRGRQERAVRDTAEDVVHSMVPNHEKVFATVSTDGSSHAHLHSARGICSLVAERLHVPNSSFHGLPDWAVTIVEDAISTDEPVARAALAHRKLTGVALPAPANGGRCALGELFHKHGQAGLAAPRKPRGLAEPQQVKCAPYFEQNSRPNEKQLDAIAGAIYAPLDGVRAHFRILRRRVRKRRCAEKKSAGGDGGGGDNGEDGSAESPAKKAKRTRVYRV